MDNTGKELAKRWRREKRMKKVNYAKVKKGMRSEWGEGEIVGNR